jgi:hypothetical protein
MAWFPAGSFFENLHNNRAVFIAVGFDPEKEPVMKVSGWYGRQLWDIELDMIERWDFSETVRHHGWSLDLEWWL